MSDVNYLEYGNNAKRLIDSGVDITEFAEQNGEVLGIILAIVIFLFFLGLIFIVAWKVIPMFLKSV